ncbi:MAG TPA: amidase [Acidimicrobiia bacterium]|nr:amidase [Acidimicrobiia bacterium]
MSRSATERVEAALAKAHATQETLNAFISIDDERALSRAADIDDRLARGDDVGPLAGMPIALKDLIDHEGRVTTSGSSFYAETATSTAESVRRLEDAGAVVIGRANLHEWAFGFNSENEHWGAVRNPWDLDTSAGGSSGGSGAAVAAGITPVAIGTDTGGSVRVPAALCGTYGLKVTYGKIPLDGVFPLVPSVDTVGPLADSVESTALAYRAMSGDATPEPERRPLRFGVPEPWFGGAPMSAQVADAFDAAIAGLEQLGHTVESIEMPDTHPSHHIGGALEEVAAVHREFRLQGKHYGKAVEERIAAVEELTPEEVAEAREWQRMIRQRFADAFDDVDLIITPTTPAMRKVIGEDLIGDKDHRAVLSYFTAVVNHALHPAISLPLAGTGAPPASLQVIGDLDSEPLLLGLGRWLEEVETVAFTPASKNSPIPGGR